LQHVDNMFGDCFDGMRIERVVQNHTYFLSGESMAEDLPIALERTDAGCEFVENADPLPICRLYCYTWRDSRWSPLIQVLSNPGFRLNIW
jgi:hypothetical protein